MTTRNRFLCALATLALVGLAAPAIAGDWGIRFSYRSRPRCDYVVHRPLAYETSYYSPAIVVDYGYPTVYYSSPVVYYQPPVSRCYTTYYRPSSRTVVYSDCYPRYSYGSTKTCHRGGHSYTYRPSHRSRPSYSYGGYSSYRAPSHAHRSGYVRPSHSYRGHDDGPRHQRADRHRSHDSRRHRRP